MEQPGDEARELIRLFFFQTLRRLSRGSSSYSRRRKLQKLGELIIVEQCCNDDVMQSCNDDVMAVL